MEEGVGHLHAVGDGVDDLLAHGHVLAVRQIVLRPHADLLQHEVELLAVELAVGPVEGRVLGGEFGQTLLGHAELHLACLLVEHGAGDELPQHLLLDAERLGLLLGQALAEALRKRCHLAVIGQAVFGRRDRRAAGGDDRVARASRDPARNAPDGEAHHEDAEQDSGGPVSGGLAKGVEHVSVRVWRRSCRLCGSAGQ